LPALPTSVSLPAPPFTVSLPASASMRSSRTLPFTESSPAVGRPADGFSTSAAERMTSLSASPSPPSKRKNSTSVTMSVPSLPPRLSATLKPPSMAVTV
jgi:hypothetical protein